MVKNRELSALNHFLNKPKSSSCSELALEICWPGEGEGGGLEKEGPLRNSSSVAVTC